MALEIHLISLILVFPIIGALLVYLLPLKNRDTKIVAVVISIIPLILSTLLMLGVLTDFVDLAQEGDFFAVEKAEWIPQVAINYHIGADALSAVLVFLTSLLVTLALIHSWDETHRHREFNAMLLFMQTTIIGVFVSLDSFLFFVFWEVGLVPMYFLIAIWGGRRVCWF
jgi:NADH-quinone oxidoreductase subunit M